MFTSLKKINLYLRLVSFWKIPLLFYCRPKIIFLDDKTIKVKIKFRRKVKNHLGSMYLGALTIGADITAGYFAFHFFRLHKKKISLIFKDFHADFYKRAMGDVQFTCDMGNDIKEMIKSFPDYDGSSFENHHNQGRTKQFERISKRKRNRGIDIRTEFIRDPLRTTTSSLNTSIYG